MRKKNYSEIEATKTFMSILKRDKDLQQAFQANIAMAFVDAARWHCAANNQKGKPIRWKDVPTIANKAADHFLDLWLGRGKNTLLDTNSTDGDDLGQ